MLTGFLGLVVLTIKLWPATPLGQCLHRAFVELPLELADRVERRHLILVGLLMFGGQLVMLLGPQLAVVYALELSIYGEAVIATTLATAVIRVRFVWHKLKGIKKFAGRALSAGRVRPRSRRTKAGTPPRKNSANDANDDDHAWAWSLRAA